MSRAEYTEYIIEVKGESGLEDEIERFVDEDEAVSFVKEYAESMKQTDEIWISYVEYNKYGEPLDFGFINYGG